MTRITIKHEETEVALELANDFYTDKIIEMVKALAMAVSDVRNADKEDD